MSPFHSMPRAAQVHEVWGLVAPPGLTGVREHGSNLTNPSLSRCALNGTKDKQKPTLVFT